MVIKGDTRSLDYSSCIGRGFGVQGQLTSGQQGMNGKEDAQDDIIGH